MNKSDLLKFFLMGKTGHGKSATGNSILNMKQFKTSAGDTSETKEVECGFSEFEDLTLMVVDGPGLEETSMDNVQDKLEAAKHVTEALAMCYGCVDVFLFVVKFGTRYTAEEKSVLEALKGIFGTRYMDHVIVVVTCGDNYQTSVEDGECESDFHEWYKKQKGEMRQLYEDCEGRFVLFNNREKNDEKKLAQIQEVVQLAKYLRDKKGRYTSQCFKDAEREREKLIIKLKAPQLTLEIQKNISLLQADIARFSKQPSKNERGKLINRIQDLRQEIEVQDKEYGVLDELRLLIDEVEHNLDDVIKLESLTKHLERIRRARVVWNAIATVLNIIGSVLSLVIPETGGDIANAVTSGLSSAVGTSIGVAETVIERKFDKITKKTS